MAVICRCFSGGDGSRWRWFSGDGGCSLDGGCSPMAMVPGVDVSPVMMAAPSMAMVPGGDVSPVMMAAPSMAIVPGVDVSPVMVAAPSMAMVLR